MNKVQKIMSVMVLAVAIVLPTKAQDVFGSSSAPVTAFRSTSTMVGSGSAYSSSPMLNEYGMATYSSASSGPRRAGSGTPGTPSTPGQGSEENQFPLGDGIVPMMVMVGLFAGFVAMRRRKKAVKG